MKVIGQNAKELLSDNTQFIIPIYQRDYAWKKEDCLRLFYDIVKTLEDKTLHFMGSYCEKTNGESVIVIDGQQRIVSLMLFLIALRDVSRNEVFQDFVDISFLTSSEKDVKLQLKKRDKDIFEKLVLEKDGLFGRPNLTKEDKNSRIYQNYELFYDEIALFLEKNPKFSLNNFLETLEDFKFAKITLEDENPQVTYETLNATGVALSEIDKIRNFVLMPLDGQEQEDIYVNYWEPIEVLLGSDFENFLMSIFIIQKRTDFLSTGEKISTKTLYPAFKEFASNKNIDELIKELLIFVRLYQDLNNKNNIFRVIYNLLKADMSLAVCLYLRQKEEQLKESLEEAFETYLSYIVRNKVCERTGLKTEHAIHLIKETRNAKTKEEFLSLFNSAFLSAQGPYKFPSNRDFKESLINKDVYLSLGSSGVKYILYEIEKTEIFRQEELPAFEEGSIEHIMPQLLSQEWERSLSNDKSCHVQYLHTLGNLAITKYNSELHNRIFSEKCSFYKIDPYYYTQGLVKYSQWGTENIRKRAEILANIAIGIWKDVSTLESQSEENINIHNEPKKFVGTKPYRVHLMGEEKEVKSWNDLLYFVSSVLYELDAVVMLQFLNQKESHKFLFDRIPNGPYRRLGDCIYLKTNGDAAQKFTNLKRLIEYYDKNAEVTISDKLWFKVR